MTTDSELEHTTTTYLRVDAIIIMMLENQKYIEKNRQPDLVAIVIEQFEVGERQAQRLIGIAKKEFRKITKLKVEKALEIAILDREFLVRKFKSSDPKLALDAMKDREKLKNLYPDPKLDVGHSGTVSVVIHDDIK